MARSKNGSASRSQPIALELLEADHRKVEALFKQYEREKEGDEETKRRLSERICHELAAHAQLEEELFYPWLKENLDAAGMELVEEAYVEHATAKDLIAQLEGGAAIDESYDAKVKVLGEYVKHHVKEEEDEIFKEVRGMREELDELGQEMHARRAELMEEHGLMEEVEVSMTTARAKGRRSRQAEQRGSR